MSKIKIKAVIFSKENKYVTENKLALKKDNDITYNDNGSLICVSINSEKVKKTFSESPILKNIASNKAAKAINIGTRSLKKIRFIEM